MEAENLHDEIARAAYELYENSGCIECRDVANWLEAERMVLARHESQEIEEPEEPTIAEGTEELEQSRSERYPASRETSQKTINLGLRDHSKKVKKQTLKKL